ncbi:MAG: type II toxin-antitoxin system prevent-host-death family antitoxin [Gemmatimonadales bacterium]|nr:type II toxin-antitoxin system prevent-host-death family antitoxin [Gemmatimonadales bacterium]
MPTYSIRDAKNRLSALLARVRRGARIVITDRGVPVAMLVRAGLVAPRRQAPSRALLGASPVDPSTSASAVDALLAERADGR